MATSAVNRQIDEMLFGTGSVVQETMAAKAGHSVSRVRSHDGTMNSQQMLCTCGWQSAWLCGGDATTAKRDHLKHTAIGI